MEIFLAPRPHAHREARETNALHRAIKLGDDDVFNLRAFAADTTNDRYHDTAGSYLFLYARTASGNIYRITRGVGGGTIQDLRHLEQGDKRRERLVEVPETIAVGESLAFTSDTRRVLHTSAITELILSESTVGVTQLDLDRGREYDPPFETTDVFDRAALRAHGVAE